MQTVFKVDLPKDGEESGERPFIPRRVHKKSRGGCSACKRRRIKCDERKPRCGKCTKTNTECVYKSPPGTSPKTLFIDERSPAPLTADMHTMCVDAAETELGGLLSLTSGLNISTLPSGSVRILHHFQTFTSLTLGGVSCRNIFHSVIAKKAWDVNNPYLMHMVLAVSCAHLKRLHSEPSQTKLHRQYSVAEAAHWQTGLQLYQKLLQNGSHNAASRSPDSNRSCCPMRKLTTWSGDSDEESAVSTPDEGAPKLDFDATLATTFLTIIFTFALDDEIPLDAYTDGDEEKFRHAINPLAATGGFRALRDLFGDYMHDSCWKTVLMGSDDSKGTFSNSEQRGTEELPAAFVDLCELDSRSNAENNEYYHIVRLLAPLLRLDHDADNFTKLIAFCGRTWHYFRPLVLRRDPRGLLLLSYWFALLPQMDQWWLTQRAKTECMAILNYLSQIDDAQVNALLPFPASFGQEDLFYIFDPPSDDSDSATIFERYFQKAVTREPRIPS